MGMDPLLQDETYEVTISVDGPVKQKKFREFRKALDDFLDACAKIETGFPDPAGGTNHPKLYVREVRGGVRKSV